MLRLLPSANKFRTNEVGVLDTQMMDHPDNQKLEKCSEVISPVDVKRRCTDVLFLALLIGAWVAMTGVGLAATGHIPSNHIKKGDPRRLVHGMDLYGNLCGVTNYQTPIGADTIDLPMAYPMPSGFSVCVESCPSETNYDNFICEYDVQHDIDTMFDSDFDLLEEKREAKKAAYMVYAAQKQCMPQVESMSFLGYCIPKLPLEEVILTQETNVTDSNSTDVGSTEVSIPIASKASSESGEFFDKAMADMLKVRYVIFSFGCGMALALGILFLIIIQLPGFLSLLVWSMIVAVDAGLVYGGYYSKGVSLKWAEAGHRTGNEVATLFYSSYVLYGLAGLWTVVVLFLRKRIVLAVQCVREAARAIASMPVITLFPAVQVLGLFAFTLVWGVYMAFLASSGDVVASCLCPVVDDNSTLPTLVETLESEDGTCQKGCFLHKELIYATNTKYAAIYMVFMWFWTSQFIVAFGQLVTAVAISLFYFNKDRSLVKNSTFFKALSVVSFKHVGTAAFGSLIIAVVKTIRAVLTYIQKKATKSKMKVAVVILSVLKCLLWCVEKCLKFINKQAYIQTAIFGYSFCTASRKGFFLILRNALRISAVSVVSNLVLFVGKVFITVAAALSGYQYLELHFGDDLNYLMVPTLLIAIVAYAVSEMFNEVFGMAISTILQCFCVDEEMFDADERYAPDSLRCCIESTQQKYKQKKKVASS